MVKDPVQLKDIYRFTFGYAKNKGEKYMAVEVACVLWTMLLKDIYPLTNDFVTFVQETDSVRVINKDQWQSFFEFMVSVADTLTGYDETSAWPVLFDEFVAWKKHH
ncbi:potentiating neddylation domain-containing protein [Spinellus fusiger]|nr:potentiating neddylation domain-containing protein [Spinellus fusiger]